MSNFAEQTGSGIHGIEEVVDRLTPEPKIHGNGVVKITGEDVLRFAKSLQITEEHAEKYLRSIDTSCYNEILEAPLPQFVPETPDLCKHYLHRTLSVRLIQSIDLKEMIDTLDLYLFEDIAQDDLSFQLYPHAKAKGQVTGRSTKVLKVCQDFHSAFFKSLSPVEPPGASTNELASSTPETSSDTTTTHIPRFHHETSDCRFIILDEESHYAKICEQYPKRHIHHVKYIQMKNIFKWVRSWGEVNNNRFKMTDFRSCDDSDVFQIIGPHCVLCLYGETTVGKTTLLAKLKENLERNGKRVAYIKIGHLYKSKLDFINAVTENKVFTKYLRYDRLYFSHIFVDGFDELNPYAVNKVSREALTRLRHDFPNQQICIAVSEELKDELMKVLPLATCEIKDFTESEYTHVLHNYVTQECLPSEREKGSHEENEINKYIDKYVKQLETCSRNRSMKLLTNPKYCSILAGILATNVTNFLSRQAPVSSSGLLQLRAVKGSSLIEAQAKIYDEIIYFEITKCVTRYYKGDNSLRLAERLYQDAQYQALQRTYHSKTLVTSAMFLYFRRNKAWLNSVHMDNYRNTYTKLFTPITSNPRDGLSLSVYLSAIALHQFLCAEMAYKDIEFDLFYTSLSFEPNQFIVKVAKTKYSVYPFVQPDFCHFLDFVTRKYYQYETVFTSRQCFPSSTWDDEKLMKAINACVWHRLGHLGLRLLAYTTFNGISDVELLVLTTLFAKVSHALAIYKCTRWNRLEEKHRSSLLLLACGRKRFSLVEYLLKNAGTSEWFQQNFKIVIRMIEIPIPKSVGVKRPFHRMSLEDVAKDEFEKNLLLNYLWNLHKKKGNFTRYIFHCIPWRLYNSCYVSLISCCFRGDNIEEAQLLPNEQLPARGDISTEQHLATNQIQTEQVSETEQTTGQSTATCQITAIPAFAEGQIPATQASTMGQIPTGDPHAAGISSTAQASATTIQAFSTEN